ncbi:MAG: DNA adenine methylase, partial [Candidatus Margulisbacteria bacterium]|nr:DNA adenine methylase [Candidatus Margulisiibacteriota bacterium]
MQQNLFLEYQETEQENKKTTNIASVPQRSPFRYPGGKTWFVPVLRKWLKSKSNKPALLIEPFAGGGIISLTAIFENLAEKALMVELDDQVAAVWQSIVEGHADWLINKILTFELNKQNLSYE